MRLKFPAMFLVIVGVSLLFAMPALAAPDATILSVTFDPATCVLTTTFQVEDAGDYFVTLFDDGVLLVAGGGTYPAGSTQSVAFTIGGPDATDGVSIAIRDSISSTVAYTFVNEQFWTDIQGIDCQERGFVFGVAPIPGADNCPIPLPAGFVVRSVPLGSPAYFDSRSDTYIFDLPAGTWYSGNSQGEFTQVWIACQANLIWIPTSNIAG